jgi:hypothetical protein
LLLLLLLPRLLLHHGSRLGDGRAVPWVGGRRGRRGCGRGLLELLARGLLVLQLLVVLRGRRLRCVGEGGRVSPRPLGKIKHHTCA